MKVILLQDVAKIGRRFEIVNVPNGYALNKLLPQKLAEAATKSSIKRIESQTSKAKADQSKTEERFSSALETLKDKSVSVAAEANEKGHLFEALKVAVVASALKEVGAEVSEEEIVIESPIKEVGEHTITLKEGEIVTKLTVTVVAS